ncbi:hypothetical protein J2Y37_000953 [Prolinoborus sp. 3657]|nr:hypothetical protein [Prolinoborus sp. 3657]
MRPNRLAILQVEAVIKRAFSPHRRYSDRR